MVHLGADWVMGISMDWCWVFLELLFTSLRFYTRRFIIGGLWYDDYVLAAAVICDIITKSLWLASFFPLYHGAKASEVSESHMVRADRIVGVMEPFIYTTFALSKAAVLTFLHRLSKTRWQRIMLLSLAIFFTSWSISIGVLITFVIFLGLSVPFVEILSTYFGFTVFLNLFLALFPWYMFRNVQMKRSKKVTICVSLGLAGILGEIACLVRNIKSITVQHDDNHLVAVQIWTCWEIGLTIVFVCIPTLRPLFKRWIRRLRSQNSRIGSVGRHSPTPSDPFDRIERGHGGRSGGGANHYNNKSRPTRGRGPDTELIHETTTGIRTEISPSPTCSRRDDEIESIVGPRQLTAGDSPNNNHSSSLQNHLRRQRDPSNNNREKLLTRRREDAKEQETEKANQLLFSEQIERRMTICTREITGANDEATSMGSSSDGNLSRPPLAQPGPLRTFNMNMGEDKRSERRSCK
ncbi:hypothetical protein V8F06_006434 [Rhypophila decipiens]